MLALAISIAMHEVAAGLVPHGTLASAAEPRSHYARARSCASRYTLQSRLRRRGTGAHEPRFVTVAAALGRAAPRGLPRRRSRQRARARRIATARALARPTRSGTRPAAQTVARSSRRPAHGTNGSATARARPATAAAPASETRPCGFVTFSDPHGSQYDPRTHGFWVDIRMSVHFADGSSQSMILDYPWYYPSEAANPWSDRNLRDPNFPTRFQQPPPEKATGEPPLVQYVMAHSTADGLTLLRDCPAPSRAPDAP